MVAQHKPLDIVITVGDVHAGMYSNSYEKFDVVKSFFMDQLIPKIIEIKSQNPGRNVTLILLGDTFDIKQQISIVIQNSMIDIMELMSYHVDVYVMVGNHDMPIADNPNINSIKILKFVPGIELVDKPCVLSDVNGKFHVLIPYNNTKEKEMDVISEFTLPDTTLYCHTEIAGFHYEGVPVDHSKHNKISDFSNFLRVISGHIHKKQEINNILFTGTPYHIRKGEDGNDTGYYIFDYKNGTETYVENTTSPRYVTVDYEFFLDMDFIDAEQLIKNNYVDVKTPYNLSNPIEKIKLIEKYASLCRSFEFSSRKPTDIKIENLIGTNGVDVKPISIQSTITDFFKDTKTFKAQKNSYTISDEEKNVMKERILKSYETYKLIEAV